MHMITPCLFFLSQNTDTLSAELNNSSCHSLEVVSLYRDPQLQVGEHDYYETKHLQIIMI